VDTAPSKQVLEWAGGSLDDLVALLSGPSWSARIEVLPASGGNAVGEVQVIAGGVSDAIFEGKSTHDALDKLRAVPNPKFRIEPRLPNPANGDLAAPGPEQGKLEERPLATLMRYCEEFVLTAGIEVWRASENAKVEYKRGEIVGVTVGGIDAPERLAEVMKWSSGSYRLVVPKLSLPDKAPKAAPPAVVAPRTMGAASKTIFGMPALDPAAIAAAADKARQAKTGATAAPSGTVPPPAAPSPSTPSMAAAPSATVPPARPAGSGRSTTVGPAVAPPTPAAAPVAPQAQPAVRASTNRTIFGVVAPAQPPQTPSTAVPAATPAAPAPAAARPSSPGATPAPPAAASAAQVSAAPPPATPTGSGPAARPTTAVSIPAVPAPPAATTRTTSPAATPAATTAVAKTTERSPAKKQKSQPPATTSEETTQPTKAKPKSKGTPIWTYVGVGFVFGLALLGVYRLVMVLAH
jgi:hypothetical protein